MKKKVIAALAMVTAVCALAACAPKETATVETAEVPAVTGEFKTTVLKTGKSDAIILESENTTILIDCGEENDGDEVVEYLQRQGKTSVDYLFITHFDQDHVGGAAEVIENIEIDEIVVPDYEGTNSEYTNFLTAVQNSGKSIDGGTDDCLWRLTSDNVMSFTLDDVLYEVYPPLKSYYAEGDNDYSIVIKATHGEDTFLFTGDAEEERLDELFEQIGDLSADFLKVPHHGRIEDNSEEFIAAVRPEYAVITCNKKEGAEDELLAILGNAGAQIYLNRNGTITAISSGSGITVTQETE